MGLVDGVYWRWHATITLLGSVATDRSRSMLFDRGVITAALESAPVSMGLGVHVFSPFPFLSSFFLFFYSSLFFSFFLSFFSAPASRELWHWPSVIVCVRTVLAVDSSSMYHWWLVSWLVLSAQSTTKVYIRAEKNNRLSLSPSYSFHKSLYRKSLFLKPQLNLYPQFRNTDLEKQSLMFWSLFIFRGHSTREPASLVRDNEQGDIFYSAGLHRNRC